MSADTELRHGYRLADLHRLARYATLSIGTRAANFQDRYDIAYGAIAEHLYAVEHPPRDHNLVDAGRRAILNDEEDRRRSQGLTSSGESPRFAAYWQWTARVTPSPEEPIVERVALGQILATVPPAQLAALQARAVFGDHKAAADALATDRRNYRGNLRYARQRILALWHEGEKPSRLWQRDYLGGEKSRTAQRALRNLRERNGTTRSFTPSPDLIPVEEGARCGSLTVLVARRRGAVKILCRCDCGTEREFGIPNLRCGKTQSCGCPQGRAAAAERNRAKQPLVPGGGNYPRTRSAALASDRRAA